MCFCDTEAESALEWDIDHTNRTETNVSERNIEEAGEAKDKCTWVRHWWQKEEKQKTTVFERDTDHIKRRSRRRLYQKWDTDHRKRRAEDHCTRVRHRSQKRKKQKTTAPEWDTDNRKSTIRSPLYLSEKLITERAESEDHYIRVRHWSQKRKKQKTTIPEPDWHWSHTHTQNREAVDHCTWVK